MSRFASRIKKMYFGCFLRHSVSSLFAVNIERENQEWINVQVWRDQIEKCTDSNTESEDVTQEAKN